MKPAADRQGPSVGLRNGRRKHGRTQRSVSDADRNPDGDQGLSSEIRLHGLNLDGLRDLSA
jgi:hypothetical protein